MRLREIRKEKGLTQEEVAVILGLPLKTYNNYEKEERKLPTKYLFMLADYYRTSCDYLLGYEKMA